MKINDRFLIIFLFSFFLSLGQNLPNDCINYIQVCDNQSISFDVSGAGIQEIVPPSCSSQENNSLWLKVTIDQGGTLGFTLIPDNTDIQEDYDFWVFGPNSDCNNLGNPIRCSTTNPLAINQSNNHTGMNANSTDTTEGPGADGDSFVKQLTTFPGNSYFIVIDRPVGNSPFTLIWNGTATIANPFSNQNFPDFNDVILCDDGANNLEPFDFSVLIDSYLANITGFELSFFNSSQDAILNTNEIIGVSNVTESTYYVRIKHLNSSCFIVKPLNVVFNYVPTLQVFGCDEANNGIFEFDTTNLEINLLNGLTGFDLTFTDENNVVLPNPLPNPFFSPEQTINVTLTSNTGIACTFQTTIDFIINKKPKIFPIAPNITASCTNGYNNMGLTATFDTTGLQEMLIGSQTNVVVEYYDENNVQLSSPLPNPFVTNSQNITVKVSNANALDCYATTTLPFNVFSLPDIEVKGVEKFVCKNLPNYFVTLNAGLMNANQSGNFTYQWFFNNNIIAGATAYTFQVNQPGSYSVNVINSNNCEKTRTILVSESDIATINNIQIDDFEINNTVIVDANGIGEYTYSLDAISFQIFNIFENVEPGIYTVYVKDNKNCGIAEKEINVLGAPKFFTPNGDGYNDFWNIKGVDAKLNANTIIRIFDRYGKLLAQINPFSSGWDGFYNNHELPADDYWYTIELVNGRMIKGHFALMR